MAFSVISRKVFRIVWNEEIVRRISLSTVKFGEDDASKKSAAEKLHSLLQDIIKDDSLSAESVKKDPVSAGDVVPKKIKRPEKPKNLGEKIVDSAKEIAKKLDGKPEETEAQLLHRLLFKDTPLSENIAKATSTNDTLKDLLLGMDVEKPDVKVPPSQKQKELTRAELVKMMMGKKTSGRITKRTVVGEKIDIFGEEPLGIFKIEESIENEVPMNTWEAMNQRELQLLVTHPPSNIFEQMIQWTERGILWKFPIDNEQGMEDEKKIDFTQHIFLENHLEGWCPEKGPIRHFMELVCVGLSRNHWLTAEEKKQHILWYRDYFTEKRALLQELEAGEIKLVSPN